MEITVWRSVLLCVPSTWWDPHRIFTSIANFNRSIKVSWDQTVYYYLPNMILWSRLIFSILHGLIYSKRIEKLEKKTPHHQFCYWFEGHCHPDFRVLCSFSIPLISLYVRCVGRRSLHYNLTRGGIENLTIRIMAKCSFAEKWVQPTSIAEKRSDSLSSIAVVSSKPVNKPSSISTKMVVFFR